MRADYNALYESLAERIPAERLIKDPLRTLAYGTDASFYRLIPRLVVRVESLGELIEVIRRARQHRAPVTFRAAGTSLSGQAITDSVLIMLGDGWSGHRISADASLISLQPGVVGAQANRWLAPFNRKIGPDPASINACKIGGIAANNASGMCCGTAQNSYHTLHSMKLVLADGTLLDTADEASRAAFRQSHGALLDALEALARQTRANEALAARIRHKYRLKNTTGYALNALVDFEDPFEILQHLMIGSEGTLGFIAEITYRTVPEHPHKASALVFFASVEATCRAVARLKHTPVSAVELMDRAGLRSVQEKPGMPPLIRTLGDDAAALLVETRAATAAELAAQIVEIEAALAGFETVQPARFTTDPAEYNQYWAIRKGLFPAVGAVRETGTTVIIEDVAFPVEQLAEAVHELHAIFRRFGYDEALIFGHALEGNLHFVFTQAFDSPEELARYAGLMDAVADLVVGRYDGSLKAEHGTGRNMAPYVELEWGSEAYQLMWEIKGLFDPDHLLNPGVILNRDPHIHLKNLKPLPPAHTLVDKCIECGFCEPTCPSRALTLTPRQRIVICREIARLEVSGEDPERLERLKQDYRWQGDETCAACGLCSTACPVGINTGDLTRALRSERNKRHRDKAAWAARHFAGLASATRFTLAAADTLHGLVGTRAMSGLTGAARKLTGGAVQQWLPTMPTAATRIKLHSATADGRPKVVYWPSCASRTMGPQRGGETRSLHEVTVALLEKAGYAVVYPDHLDRLCCGMPFQSKGFFDAARSKAEETAEALLAASEQGRWPIFSDTSPCTLRMQESVTEKLEILEPAAFIERYLLDRLEFSQQEAPVALHITCSATRMGLADTLLRLARLCARDVIVPEGITCCGFAGDKGFTTPELNASALRHLKAQIPPECREGFSNSRTCETGLSFHAGIEYKSIVYLVERQSRPRQPADAGPDDRTQVPM